MFDPPSNGMHKASKPAFDDRLCDDPSFCDALADCDEALVRGEPTVEESVAECGLPPERQAALAEASDCLQLLHRVIEGDLLRPDEVLSDTLLDEQVAGDIPPGEARLSLAPGSQRHTLGRFELHEVLGAGGFGIVYRAWDPITQRDVALKIPRIEALASLELQQRFEQEARAAAKLDHPNIVSVHEAGREETLPYIVSQYYRGMSLSNWLKDVNRHLPVTARQAAETIANLAQAVAHAHERGVLHRDIKPSNILLVPKSSAADTNRALIDFVPKLMDFGLAKVASAASDMTRTGAMLGTLQYMPPEQAAGSTKQIGPASDVYSLGAVLYELLAGRPPFLAESDLALLRQIQSDEPTAIRHGRAIPTDLETICFKCLEKEPNRRYPSAQALADDLNRYLQGMPILARRATPLQRLEKWTRRNPQLALSVVAAACALVIFVAMLMVSNRRLVTALALTEQQRQIANERAESIREYAYGLDVKLAQEAWENSNPTLADSYLDKYRPKPPQRDLRRFEWYYLKDSIREGADVVARQATPVWSMAVSPDERRLATADRDGVIRLWSLDTKALLQELRGHKPGDIDGLVFSNDGNVLISASNDHTIRLWNADTGDVLNVLNEHRDWIGGLAVSRDGTCVASGDAEGRVLLWNLPQGDSVRELYRHPGPVRWIVFHPHRPILVSACEMGQVRIWDYKANQAPIEAPEGRLEAPPDPSWRNATFLADGLQLWAPNRARLLRWDFGSRDRWSVLGRDFGTDHKIMAIAAIGMGNHLLAAHDEQFTITLRQAKDPATAVKHFRGHDDSIRAIATVDSGNAFLTGSEDGTVRRWQLSSSSRYATILELPADSLAFAWAPDRNALAVGLVDGRLGVVQAGTNSFQECASLDGSIERVLWSPDGERICGISDRGTIGWVDPASHQLLASFDIGQPVLEFALDPSGIKLALACRDHQLAVHDALTGRQLWAYEKPGQGVSGVSFRNDRELVAWFIDGDVECFDGTTGRLVRKLPTHKREVTSIAFSEDGRILATSSLDKAIRFFDTHSLQEIRQFTLTGDVGRVLFFDRDARLLASVEGELLVLDSKTGQVLLRLPQTLHGAAIGISRDRSLFAGRVEHGLLIHSLRASEDGFDAGATNETAAAH